MPTASSPQAPARRSRPVAKGSRCKRYGEICSAGRDGPSLQRLRTTGHGGGLAIIVLALSCVECQYVEARRADLFLRVHRV
jgi:hypothetical protein